MYIEFLEGQKFPKKNAHKADNPQGFKDAGYILKEEEIVVDIDNIDKDIIRKMIEFFKINTQIVWTGRGAHFYFKKPLGFKGNKIICPLGFQIEYKHSKNTPNGITIKQNGIMRKIENEGIREDLPDIFKYKRGLKPLLGLDEYEGRNNDLFTHRMRIHDFPQLKNILRFINDYIFATPLPEAELQVLLRDGVRPKAEKDNQPVIANYLKNQYKIVFYAGRLYWYMNKQYICEEEKFNRLLAEEIPEVRTSYYKEIRQQLEYIAPLIPDNKIFNIKLQNGILNDGNFYAYEFTDFTPFSIDIPYDKNAQPIEVVDDYLNHLCNGDDSFRCRLLETFAHCLIVDPDFKRLLGKFFIFIGGGGNGKGTFLQVVKTILGSKNCSALSIKQLQDERYASKVEGKLCNLGDDIEDEYINKEQIKLLKNISTCDFITVRRLYEQPKDVVLTASLIFTSNHLLKAREKGNSYQRRVMWIPVDKVPGKKDGDLVKKLTTPEALVYWMKLIVEAYQRLYKNKCFTECELIENYNLEYHKYNNNINQFLDEYPNRANWVNKMGKKSAFELYKNWCENNFEKFQAKEKLFFEICKRFDCDCGTIKDRRNGKDSHFSGFFEKGIKILK